MATIKTADKSIEVADGSPVKDACKQLGIEFGCEAGMCRACKVEVLDGMDNLGEYNQKEVDLAMADKERLMCQCKISGGEILIEQ
jgi:ferredoxin